MFSLKSRRDSFKLVLPKTFICPEIEEKYAKVLIAKKSFYTKPIDFINESIQKVQVFGFQNASFQQLQQNTGEPMINPNRIKQNNFFHPASEYTYRSQQSPINLIDKTINVDFRLTLGYLNYLLLFENFFYQYSRDRKNSELEDSFDINVYDEKGSICSTIKLIHPIVNGMDMLDLDYSQPIAESQTFRIEFKYSNIDFQFIDINDNISSEIYVNTNDD